MSYTAEEIKSASKNICWVDATKNVSEQHHIRPVEYGGPRNGLTVPLCPTCHTNIHREASYQLKRGTIGKYVNSENYTKIESINRALFLAGYIVKSKQVFEDSGEEKAEGARNMSQVSWTREELAMAHDLKKMLGYTSLPRMIKSVVISKWHDLQRGKQVNASHETPDRKLKRKK